MPGKTKLKQRKPKSTPKGKRKPKPSKKTELEKAVGPGEVPQWP